MGNSNINMQNNCQLVKELVLKNTPYRSILQETSLKEEQLQSVLIKLRQNDFRVFLGKNFHEDSLCTREEYIKQMNYNDKIETSARELKLLVTSDYHYCSNLDTPDYVDKTWDFATEAGIKHILNLGDLTEGIEYHTVGLGRDSIKIEPTLESQMIYIDRNLPKANNIRHNFLFGNHDLYSNDGISIDIIKELKNNFNRNDIHVCGIENEIMQVNNDNIHLLHRSYPGFVKDYIKGYENFPETQIMFCGHAHISQTLSDPGYLLEYVPPLCNIDHMNKQCPFFVGFLLVTFEFNMHGKIKKVIVQRYKFSDLYTKPVCFHSHEVNVRRLKK